MAKAQKGNQTSINQPALKSILISSPTIKEQSEIEEILTIHDSKITALDHEARLLQELFRAMLEELMSGRLQAGALAAAESSG
jgi:type I restriction enzyme, S subunit